MSSENESLLPAIQNNHGNLPARLMDVVDYDIAGNAFRAYYDGAKNIVFVVDVTQSARKPNVLLVVPGDGDRKWDDILAADYGVDLETIRPRKDNKYQKLDVEYADADVYGRLVREYQAGADLNAALAELNAFRDNAVRRNALVRLDAARDMAARANETIDKTNDTIADLNVRIKELRAKLIAQKKSVGKEPTKQSAAKILRSDSQIDATGEKIERARRRLANARRRLIIAEDDIAAAQNILDLLGTETDSGVASHSIMAAPKMEMMALQSSDAPQFTEIITEPKAEEMAEEEVKPLFDKDPEILDQEIAFKPIDFGVSAVTSPAQQETNVDVVVDTATPAPAPLSFTPPRASEPVAAAPISQNDFAPMPDVPAVSDTSVLDSMRPATPVAQPVAPRAAYDAQPAPARDEQEFAYAAAQAPIVERLTPVTGASEYNNAANAYPAAAPMPNVADAGRASGFRPVSPIRGAAVTPAATGQSKSKLLYYVMLILLIALSIFTLWIYQRSTSQNIPDLSTTTNVAVVSDDDANQPSPFVAAPVADATPDTADVEPVAEPVVVAPVEVAPEIVEPIVPDVEPEPVQPEPVIAEPEPVAADDAPDVAFNPVEAASPFLTEPVEKGDASVDIISIVNKPIYNVSQQEKMFVAAPDYETDAPAANADVATDEEVCSDGALPDANGCCGGEVFTDMEDGTFACCQPIQDGECFAPLR